MSNPEESQLFKKQIPNRYSFSMRFRNRQGNVVRREHPVGEPAARVAALKASLSRGADAWHSADLLRAEAGRPLRLWGLSEMVLRRIGAADHHPRRGAARHRRRAMDRALCRRGRFAD